MLIYNKVVAPFVYQLDFVLLRNSSGRDTLKKDHLSYTYKKSGRTALNNSFPSQASQKIVPQRKCRSSVWQRTSLLERLTREQLLTAAHCRDLTGFAWDTRRTPRAPITTKPQWPVVIAHESGLSDFTSAIIRRKSQMSYNKAVWFFFVLMSSCRPIFHDKFLSLTYLDYVVRQRL